jgi:hypothetical protein
MQDAVIWLLGVHWGTASLLEVVWTAAGLYGLVVTLVLARGCLVDLAVLKASSMFQQNGARHIIARQHLRNMLERVLLFALLTLIGILALFAPAPVGSEAARVRSGVFSVAVLAVEIALVLGAWWDQRDGAALLRQIRMRQTDHPAEG